VDECKPLVDGRFSVGAYDGGGGFSSGGAGGTVGVAAWRGLNPAMARAVGGGPAAEFAVRAAHRESFNGPSER
jgi:hypothetical protein